MLSRKVGSNSRGSGDTEENCLRDTGLCFAVLSNCKTRAVWLFIQWFWITEVWHWHLSDLHRQWNWQGRIFYSWYMWLYLSIPALCIQMQGEAFVFTLFLSKIKELLLVGKWRKLHTRSNVMRLLLWKWAIAPLLFRCVCMYTF